MVEGVLVQMSGLQAPHWVWGSIEEREKARQLGSEWAERHLAAQGERQGQGRTSSKMKQQQQRPDERRRPPLLPLLRSAPGQASEERRQERPRRPVSLVQSRAPAAELERPGRLGSGRRAAGWVPRTGGWTQSREYGWSTGAPAGV